VSSLSDCLRRFRSGVRLRHIVTNFYIVPFKILLLYLLTPVCSNLTSTCWWNTDAVFFHWWVLQFFTALRTWEARSNAKRVAVFQKRHRSTRPSLPASTDHRSCASIITSVTKSVHAQIYRSLVFVMSPLRRHIFIYSFASWQNRLLGGFSALAPYKGVGPI